MAMLATIAGLAGPCRAEAQVRGVYPLGMSATNAGITPDPGFSYVNQTLFYSRDELKGPDGERLATGNNSVILAMNTFVWVSATTALAGARFSMSATLPISNNALSSDSSGSISGGGGFADSYYQPFILGWQNKHSAVRAIYGFLAPTGEFKAGANQNVGSGYWTHVAASGQTWQLASDDKVSISAFEMYEFHTAQESTRIHPGQNLDLDYSVMRTLTPRQDIRVQLGLVGYGQWQTTDKRGPGVTPEQAAAHYLVNALGFASNIAWPQRSASLGFKYFREFANRSTLQGYSVQVAGSIGF
jgi:hypothetical protein